MLENQTNNTLQDDLFVMGNVRGNLLSHELELFATKWFEYREITSLQATRLYLEAHERVYRAEYARNFDKAVAEVISVPTFDSIMADLACDDEKLVRRAKQRLTGAWRGRQVADALGMPYFEYINMAMTFRLKSWSVKGLPTLTYLYSEYIVEQIQDRWEEIQRSRLFICREPSYLAQNYHNVAHQNDHHEWLFKQAGNRENIAETLANFVNEDLVHLEKVETRYGEKITEQMQLYLH